ncbi:MAG: GFA family protein [Oricola sp.]
MLDRTTGGCLCGAVTYEISGPLRGVFFCHCSQCRKQSGHFVAATACEDADLSLAGADNLSWYAASEIAKRGFCRNCGSLLFWKQHDLTTTSVMAGSVDLPSGLHGTCHVYVADKGDYYDITDGLPQE